MKSYSSDSITAADLAQSKAEHIALIDSVDQKQSRQITQLRYWLIASFVLNALLTVALHLA
jgi:hypothetical protein